MVLGRCNKQSEMGLDIYHGADYCRSGGVCVAKLGRGQMLLPHPVFSSLRGGPGCGRKKIFSA